MARTRKTKPDVDRFDGIGTNAARALQSYLILIGCAAQRRTIRHRELAQRLGYRNAGHSFGPMLGHVFRYCERRGLPCLTSLVVKESGEPRDPLVAGLDRPPQRLQEEAFAYDWHADLPPAVEALADAWAASRGRGRTA